MQELASRTEDLASRDERVIADSMRLRQAPLFVDRAQGCTITDLDGRDYLDLTAGWCVANTGYGHPRIAEAIAQSYSRLSFVSAVSVVHPGFVELAEQLIALTPGSWRKKVTFANSGSEANEGVSKMVPMATGRPRMISFMGGMHGMSAGSAGLSAIPFVTRFSGGGHVTRAPFPNPYRPVFGGTAEQDSAECLRFLEEQIFVQLAPPEQTSAIIVEPIQSDAGVIIPPDSFLPGLERLCRKYNLLLIDDEVKIGCGRTGSLWGCEQVGVSPDIMVIGKSLGAGLPISAIVGPAQILDAVPLGHAFTLSGNPTSCAAALANLEVIQSEGLAANATAMGARMMSHLRDIQARHEWIGDVRGKGLFVGVELVRDRHTKEAAGLETAKLCYRAFELGMILQYMGVRANVLEITPPLTINAAEVDRGMAILDRALTDVENGLVPDDRIGKVGW